MPSLIHRRTLATALAALAFAALLAACGSFGQPPATTVLVGDQAYSAQIVDIEVPAKVSQDQAIALAHRYVPNAQSAKSLLVRFAALTLRDSRGNVMQGIQARPVWLVRFDGVTYSPTPGAGSTAAPAVRPNTTVAIDANDGSLVVVFGVGV